MNSRFYRYRCNQCLNIFRYWNLTKLLDTTVCMLHSWNVLVIICPPLCVMYSMRVSLLVIFWALLNGLILIPYTRRKTICAKRITGLLMYWPLFLRYLKELMTYFVSILNHSLSAYRAGYSCQHVILQCTEFWRQSLDKGNCVGTMTIDLSKAFDSMPHGLNC